VSNLTINPYQAKLNQEVTVSVNVANTSSTSESYNLQLKVDGVVKLSKQVTIAAGKSQTVNFTVSGDTAGRHQIEIAGLNDEFVVEPSSAINWWLIGGITGAILLIIIIVGLTVRRRQLRGY
jgi:hypothetical protein